MPQAPEFDGRRTAAWCLHAQQVFDGHALRPEQAQAVMVVHGRIAAVQPYWPAHAPSP
ncbi:hypothetical protein [Verminephrobacter aporrectodeae]|uniref:hypothetical protein n=1 Tax=Verminephrobacter aporrectodeae TaxID=1110389 RepID=UPI0022441461|nr:hypothetical protein [Verminephrobacter aporrectodeae]